MVSHFIQYSFCFLSLNFLIWKLGIKIFAAKKSCWGSNGVSYERQRPLAIPQYPFFLSPTIEEHCGVAVATGVREKNTYSSFLCRSVGLSSEVLNGIWAEAITATFSLLERKNSLLYSFPLSNCLDYRHRGETLWTLWMGRQPTYGRELRLKEPRSLSFWQNHSKRLMYSLLGERKINFCFVWATAVWCLCCSNIPVF